MSSVTYADAGVDMNAGDELVERIKPLAKRTMIPEMLDGIGGFAGLCAIPKGMKEPVLVTGTDGVGTKLKLAFLSNKHDSIGIDLVAMCVNDVLTTGARPLIFLDYFATGQLDVDQAESVIRGIARGCEIGRCALAGGETAEMPGFYAKGHYDLAGFALGVVEREKILNGKTVQEGDALIGLPSSGLHSNGYSLARKLLIDGDNALDTQMPFGETKRPLIDVLLEPTIIYTDVVTRLLETGSLRALAHITGGGIPGNLPRVLPDGLGAEIWDGSWTAPEIFSLLQERGNVATPEMRRTFNMGIGMIAVVAAKEVDSTLRTLVQSGEAALHIGTVIRTNDPEERVIYKPQP